MPFHISILDYFQSLEINFKNDINHKALVVRPLKYVFLCVFLYFVKKRAPEAIQIVTPWPTKIPTTPPYIKENTSSQKV